MLISKIAGRISKEVYEALQVWSSLFPGTIGKYTRMLFYRCYTKKQGQKFSTGILVKIQVPGSVEIGDNVSLNDHVWIAANQHKNGGVIIHDNVLIGPFTVLHSGNHYYENPNMLINKQGFRFATITIESDVWIAARCTILSGVTIGKGAVIAAGTVVTKSIPPYAVVAGVPGRIIGSRQNT